ncbi:helix-turn-helix transcriptional regulator [Pedobacter sp. MC2016-24]|uniref:helix-turn-helix domain-containing protein n=1 Tax=Pedobacter sp. MC2016-24 TaxID=2780090 RepID=UPI00187EE553|nr:helix-turn-helix transcriptional regulator [Pedobacter sp. MC2016-24]MBE9598004.1 helix-turn-helix transcriptional regulator [Pedobacter sp. MC2016-24]
MINERFLKARENVQPEHRIFVRKNLALIEQIFHILNEKGWTQKRLATELGKSESEISKWLSGMHNFTFQTISKIEAVLGQEILVTPRQLTQKISASVDITAKKIVGEVLNRVHNEPSIIRYDASLDLKSDGKTIIIEREKKMILNKHLPAIEVTAAKVKYVDNTSNHDTSAA